MNNLELKNDLYFPNSCGSTSQFSNGIKYCECEQQIDFLNIFLCEKKSELGFVFQARRLWSTLKKFIREYSCRQISKLDKIENDSVGKSQSLLKNISYDAAWASSLLALTSLGITTEISDRWSDTEQDIAPGLPSLELPSPAMPINFQRFNNRLFPLLTIKEIDLVTWKDRLVNNFNNILPTTLPRFWQISDFQSNQWQSWQPINHSEISPSDEQLQLSHNNSSGLLMAMPPLPKQVSFAGVSTFLPSLGFIDLNQNHDFNRSNSTQEIYKQLSSSPANSISSKEGIKLMAIPETGYKPHLPRIALLELR